MTSQLVNILEVSTSSYYNPCLTELLLVPEARLLGLEANTSTASNPPPKPKPMATTAEAMAEITKHRGGGVAASGGAV